ncbi:BlaI/MecI/CopY family transcriptional regulator [Myxococcus faecalis]|jgi:predicted transcriptional regulator|uniref:Transcriptional regulator n=1 Tax=Myxococcus fulvus TaxID=33 RepID=A0A511T2U4_MYXFU|nr:MULTISPECIES: BlaI/MecI/CopY family transcriptional regulator [Myxococcus]AKF79101.1 transcriptional regulator [Myxococcus fulvus 124B02]BDT30546.1 BlaI/MecI/CopY family transcriptional regulator [Myxococcus sp. MH1]MBZ4395195.1 BlaI/MecI/CopY family transcriptional regulator [Myxococcus sp. AS-1-15]SES74742.1 Predicted transcriptional regulator [Myxococcus fulvus]GEN07933.1 transcriptional regulator [Myxococcus fulvus]
MSEAVLPRPTDGELAILRVLWERGDSTVREVHEVLTRREPGDAGPGYTTVLKLMQIMTDKGLVERDETQRAHVYRAKATEQRTQRQLVTDLVERAFGGSPARLAMQALSSRKTSPQELAQLRQLLDSLEGADE